MIYGAPFVLYVCESFLCDYLALAVNRLFSKREIGRFFSFFNYLFLMNFGLFYKLLWFYRCDLVCKCKHFVNHLVLRRKIWFYLFVNCVVCAVKMCFVTVDVLYVAYSYVRAQYCVYVFWIEYFGFMCMCICIVC